MSCYYQNARDMLVLKCDSCKVVVDLYQGQTDRLMKHDYIRENGWKTMKLDGRWVDLCPDCKSALYEARREAFIRQATKEG